MPSPCSTRATQSQLPRMCPRGFSVSPPPPWAAAPVLGHPPSAEVSPELRGPLLCVTLCPWPLGLPLGTGEQSLAPSSWHPMDKLSPFLYTERQINPLGWHRPTQAALWRGRQSPGDLHLCFSVRMGPAEGHQPQCHHPEEPPKLAMVITGSARTQLIPESSRGDGPGPDSALPHPPRNHTKMPPEGRSSLGAPQVFPLLQKCPPSKH